MPTPNTNLQKHEFHTQRVEPSFICLTLAVSAISAALRFSALSGRTKTMAKRMQDQKGDNWIVAKSKPTTMNLSFSVSTTSSAVNSPIASKSREILKAPCRTDWSNTGKLDARDYNYDAVLSS